MTSDLNYDWKHGATSGLVVVSVMASVASNAAFGRWIGNTSCRYRLRFSPSRRAFRIWGLIYTLAFACLVEQAVTLTVFHEPLPPAAANGLYALAWLSSAFWVPTFSANTGGSLLAATVFLTLTASFAFGAAVYASPWRQSANGARRWITGGAYSMLAGWTALAATLNGGIAAKANDPGHPEVCDRSDEDYTILRRVDSAYSTPIPFAISVGLSIASVAIPDPILPIPVAWAVAFMRPSYWNYAAFVMLMLSSTAAFFVAYM